MKLLTSNSREQKHSSLRVVDDKPSVCGILFFMGKTIKNPKIGDRAGRLILVRVEVKTGLNNRKRELFYCECDCGTILDWIRPSDFGNKKSCGCLDKERLHHKAHTKIWSAWQKMKSRCNNKNNPKYPIYGAAGRFVCQGLMESKHFFKIVGEPPTKEHSLDRKNNDGNYTCGECSECIEKGYDLNIRWATPSQQANNVSTNVMVIYKGEEMTLVNASRKAKLPYKTVHHRIALGWSVENALSTPIQKLPVMYNGKPIAEIAKEYGISKHNLYDRVKNQGMSFEEAISKPVLKRNRRK